MAEAFQNVDLLLIGKTGHGKSATGNSILGHKEFESCGRMESVTNSVDFGISQVDNRVIMVVDVPGVCDTGENGDRGLTNMLESAIAKHPRGYHALLLVYKYGERYTKEEERTVEFLKEKLGNDFIKNHAIVILTNGDTFEKEGNSRDDYEAWCRNTSGPFHQLLEECSFRTVLFNNHDRDEKVLTSQRNALLNIIETKIQFNRYDHETFQFAQNIQASVTREAGKPIVTEEIVNSCSLIRQKAEDFLEKPEEERPNDQLKAVLNETECLHKKITEEDKKSGSLKDVFEFITLLQTELKEKKLKKTAKNKKPKGASIGVLVQSIHSSGLDSSKRMALRQSFKKIKSNHHINVTEKVAQTIHGQF